MRSTYGTMYYVDDMKKSVAYFKKLLGLKPGYQSAEWTEFPIGKHHLCLHAQGHGAKTRPNGVLIVDAKGVKALFEKLRKARHRVFGLHEVHPAAWTFTLADPSGNELSFYGSP
jgi:catechol 2,3-dioxygenase-like lactoylglutathione lyase family enzyme